jgi:hypothetical protein
MMQAIAHGAKPKGKSGPSRKVAQEFAAADHARGATNLPQRIAGAVVSGKPKSELY